MRKCFKWSNFDIYYLILNVFLNCSMFFFCIYLNQKWSSSILNYAYPQVKREKIQFEDFFFPIPMKYAWSSVMFCMSLTLLSAMSSLAFSFSWSQKKKKNVSLFQFLIFVAASFRYFVCFWEFIGLDILLKPVNLFSSIIPNTVEQR